MSKNMLYKLLGALVVLAAVVLWLLGVLMPESFGFFNLAWAGVLLCGGLGVIMLIQGLFQKNISTIKKLKIWFGAGLLIGALLCLVSAIALPGSIILPIIAIILAFGLVLTIFATGGARWDEGDNGKAGYKNYHERKAEEEKQQNQD
ncbi:MAG: hypothetical protein IJ301_04735 [Clostridia bacterium]|nr:hypothetical protein [Clostridia bacterium]